MIDFDEIPELVFYVKAARHVGSAIFDKALEKHPEHFKDEVQYRKKWEKIPDWVHQAFREKALIAYHETAEKYPTPNQGAGVLWLAMNPDKAEKDIHAEARRKEISLKIDALDKAYYHPYLKP